MQPRPRAETSSPLFPSIRFCIVSSSGLAVNCGVEGFRNRCALDVDRGEGFVDLTKILLGQLDVGRRQVVVEMLKPGASRDRHDPWFLSEQPGERDLRRCDALARGEAFEEINDFEIRGQCLWREARKILPQIVRIVEFHVLGNLAGQKSLAERPPGDEANPELLAKCELRLLRLAHPQRVVILDGGDWLYGVSLANARDARFRQAEMADLARCNQSSDRVGDILHRHGGVNPMLVQEIDMVGAKALQGSIDDFTNMLGPAIEPDHLAFVGDLEAELRADQRPIANRLQRFADQFFIDEGPVALGGVEKCNAPINSRTDNGDGFLAIGRRSKAEAKAHAAEADGRDFQSAFAKSTFLHFFLPVLLDQTRSRTLMARRSSIAR